MDDPEKPNLITRIQLKLAASRFLTFSLLLHVVIVIMAGSVVIFKRFADPRQLMAYLGLTPSERSSGAKTARGAITKAGNTRARRMLVEGAWTYRLPARMGAAILERNTILPQAIKDIAWKAQVRLCARSRRLARAGKPTNVVCVAIARELAAFVWAIATNAAVTAVA